MRCCVVDESIAVRLRRHRAASAADDDADDDTDDDEASNDGVDRHNAKGRGNRRDDKDRRNERRRRRRQDRRNDCYAIEWRWFERQHRLAERCHARFEALPNAHASSYDSIVRILF